jgi:tungstate transport system permease protein
MILEAMQSALHLLTHPTREFLGIVLLTFAVSGASLMLAALAGVPLGAALALGRFRGRGAVIACMNAFMGLPPVVVGLVVYLVLSRSGPLGFMQLLYTPSAMVIAQFVLALPIVVALAESAVAGVDPTVRLAARTLGASPAQISRTVVFEARYGIYAAVVAALGRVMAEVGAVLMVGGNIKGQTRVMTTTIALETDKGEFALALALGIVLLLLSVGLNVGLHALRSRGARRV